MSRKPTVRSTLGAGTAIGLPRIAIMAPGASPPAHMRRYAMAVAMATDTDVRQDAMIGLRIANGLTAEEARRERAIAEAVRRVLVDLAKEHGAIVRDIKVTPPTSSYWKKISITMWGYGDHGVPQTIIRDFDIAPDGEIDEDRILVRVTNEYGRFFAKQKTVADRHGGPVRHWATGDIDLSLYSIEAPIWRYLQDRLGDKAETALRRILLAGSDIHSVTMTKAAGVEMGDLSITTSRGAIRGQFTIHAGDQTVKWSKGSVKVEGLMLTDTIAQSIRGRQLNDVVAHPFFIDDIAITSAQPSMRKDRVSTVFDTKGGRLALPVTSS